MNELIKISKHETLVNSIDARELHQLLESKQQFGNWISNRIEAYNFVENVDYAPVNKIIKVTDQQLTNSIGERKDYLLSLDMAKELAMVEHSEQGKKVRRYFIECEKKLNNLSPMEMVITSAQAIIRIEKEQAELSSRIEAIEAKQQAITDDFSYFTVLAYSKLNNINVDLSTATRLGKKATLLSREREVLIDKVRDSRFGQINAYQEQILNEIFAAELSA
jgi:phage anti-repressor protein